MFNDTERNNYAQIHVIDAITAVSIIVLVLIFIQTLPQTQSVINPNTNNQLKILADDALRILDSQKSSEEPTLTKLEYYLYNHVIYNITSHDLTNYLNNSLPAAISVSYNLWYYNVSCDNASNATVLWFPKHKPRSPYGTVVRSHRIVLVNNRVYDVILEVWSL